MKKIISLLVVMLILVSFGSVLAEDNQFEAGKWEGNVFTSAIGGYQFTSPEGMSPMAQEQIDALVALGNQAMGNSQETADAAASLTYYDFGAISLSNDNATVAYINLSLLGSFAELYTAKAQAEATKQALETQNFEVSDVVEDEFFGETFQVMGSTMKMGEVSISQKIFIRKLDNYIQTITLSAIGEEKLEELIDAFAPIA